MAKPKKPARRVAPATQLQVRATPHDQLLQDLRGLIEQTRGAVARAVNSALVLLYWQVGHRIRTEILKEQRAAYGEQIVQTVSGKLAPEFGNGYGARNLFRMVRFAEVFPERQIVSTLSTQLGWSHFVEIIPLDDELKRDFYAEMCRVERWSVRTLRAKVRGMLFERTALSKKPAELARQELAALREEDTLTCRRKTCSRRSSTRRPDWPGRGSGQTVRRAARTPFIRERTPIPPGRGLCPSRSAIGRSAGRVGTGPTDTGIGYPRENLT
jgi:hypothetical protein